VVHCDRGCESCGVAQPATTPARDGGEDIPPIGSGRRARCPIVRMGVVLVVAVDVGSIRHHRFAWSAQAVGAEGGTADGRDPDTLVCHIETALLAGERVALGFESPLVVPVPEASCELGAARVGEPGRAWSASAGASVLATGLVQLAWTLRRLAPVAVTTMPQRWSGDVPLAVMGGVRQRCAEDREIRRDRSPRRRPGSRPRVCEAA
jgi:hypothetical protein